jgi:hypothetical protein
MLVPTNAHEAETPGSDSRWSCTAVIAMVADATYGDIGQAIHVHPTVSEGMNSAAIGVHRAAGAEATAG